MLEHLTAGFVHIFEPSALLALLAGTVIGYFVGAMPGLNPTLGISLLIPFTFGMKPVPAIVLLTGLYMACEYGGGITAILINTPGTSAAAATALDGYPLTRQGQAGRALGISMISSGIGNLLSTVLLLFSAVPLAAFALKFGGPEYFALAFLGLSIVSTLSAEDLIRGCISAIFGLLLSCIGVDAVSGTSRFVVSYHFLGGMPFVPAMVGLFAISEVFSLFEKSEEKSLAGNVEGKVDSLPTVEDIKYVMPTILRGTLLGYIVGVIPAAGANIASWLAYNNARQRSGHPEKFGHGAIEGIAACESANNAAVSGALVPLLTLGIPGSSAAAVLIGALTIQGLQPGPLLFTRNPEIPYSIIAAFLLGAPLMTGLGIFCARFFAKVTLVPREIVAFSVLGVCILGTFALDNSMFYVWVMFAFGIVGYFMKKCGYPAAPMVLAMVLGQMAEYNLRLALLMGKGSFMIFLRRPICLIVLILTLFSLAWPLWRKYKMKRYQVERTAKNG
ncbi:MAG: tripartite tricarboxylate transporter permease [Synergistaceae bacterium]|jgi:putative tricarboxylic transport membrane protein|nr:tripartite tricarboxylate transporter permease [Synergistaceae bacterium]